MAATENNCDGIAIAVAIAIIFVMLRIQLIANKSTITPDRLQLIRATGF
jgi:hypothetical protein